MSTKIPRGCEKVCQCLLSSFSGAPLSEPTANLHFAGLLPLLSLLSSSTLVPVYESHSARSLYVVEPDCPAGSRVWSDLLHQRSNRSGYFHGRHTRICGTSARPHPSGLHPLGYAPSAVLSA